jgi:hypothetical protein
VHLAQRRFPEHSAPEQNRSLHRIRVPEPPRAPFRRDYKYPIMANYITVGASVLHVRFRDLRLIWAGNQEIFERLCKER